MIIFARKYIITYECGSYYLESIPLEEYTLFARSHFERNDKALESEAVAITSGAFIKKHKLASASSVQAALKGLLEKDFVTLEAGVYQIYDRFLGIWLGENY